MRQLRELNRFGLNESMPRRTDLRRILLLESGWCDRRPRVWSSGHAGPKALRDKSLRWCW